MWIDQNGKKAMHECKLLGSVSYNLSTSSKCALLMPCTNGPFKCKMPGCNMYVCTYSMKTHYAENHKGAEVSQDVKNQVLLKPHERTCQSIGGSRYQGYKNFVSHFDEHYEKQRGNVHMCIGG